MDYSAQPKGVYAVIDNKSFYASVECTSRGLDPLTTPLLVVSEAANTGSGLVMASSPMAKKLFDIKNVNRMRDIPHDPRIIIAPPRMNLYIKKNHQVNDIFREYVASEDLLIYSIDESILDLTHSWRLKGKSVLEVIRRIQREVKDKLGLITTVGLGDNPVQAKIALDVYAKHDQEFIGRISYDTVKEKIWTVPELTAIWGINKRTEKRLNRLGIHSVRELAEADPYLLKQHMGIVGTQLYATAWGIDQTNLHEQLIPHDKSIGNSQVLPRDYRKKEEIEVVIKELGEQTMSRARAHGKQVGGLYLRIGYALSTQKEHGTGFAHSFKLPCSTNDVRKINDNLIYLFEKYWNGETPVRQIGVSLTRLTEQYGEQLDLFAARFSNVKPRNELKLEETVDQIRERFGKTAIMSTHSIEKGGTFVSRSKLVGGHSGGNSLE